MSVLIETPSKIAAASLSHLDLTKPAPLELTKAAPSNGRKEHTSSSVVDELHEEGRDRFVGNMEITCDKDEPLLKESGNRFVLFPIKYHEVSLLFSASLYSSVALGVLLEKYPRRDRRD